MIFEDDYNKGKMTEDEHFEFLKEHFNEPNLKQNKRYSTFDFNSDNITIELKKRNFDSTKYKDLMIGLNKIERAKKLNKDIYFVMCLDDGIFSYKYSENDTLNYRVSGRRDRGFNEFKPYAFIPIDYFRKIK
jgi:hypothetical protein